MKIVAIVECATGNAKIGTMWKETAIFSPEQSLETVVKWAKNQGWRSQHAGDLTLTIAMEMAP
jgi:hypothetical protein